jgi:ribosome-interacting GTPase 1
MPANLSPEYKAAEAAFRKARDPRERLGWLREMLRAIPKHKGTDHLQADIKRRIKELSEEVEGGKKGGAAHGGPALVIRPEGAAQIALLGPPNAGKSMLHARLTASNAHVASYPFTTQFPEPGMLPVEDIHLQLVDLPAVSSEHPVPWLAGALQTADAALLVVDLGDAACVEQVHAVHALLQGRRVALTEHWSGGEDGAAQETDDPFAIRLPTLLLANKSDLIAGVESELRVFQELTGVRYPALAVSAATGHGLAEIGPWLFRALGIVRVYTKTPGKPAEKEHPFALRRGQTIEDVTRLVHKDLLRSVRYARIWSRSGYGGQHVGREHVVEDGDVVELHT